MVEAGFEQIWHCLLDQMQTCTDNVIEKQTISDDSKKLITRLQVTAEQGFDGEQSVVAAENAFWKSFSRKP